MGAFVVVSKRNKALFESDSFYKAVQEKDKYIKKGLKGVQIIDKKTALAYDEDKRLGQIRQLIAGNRELFLQGIDIEILDIIDGVGEEITEEEIDAFEKVMVGDIDKIKKEN